MSDEISVAQAKIEECRHLDGTTKFDQNAIDRVSELLGKLEGDDA
jgi:hypothetical protein